MPCKNNSITIFGQHSSKPAKHPIFDNDNVQFCHTVPNKRRICSATIDAHDKDYVKHLLIQCDSK